MEQQLREALEKEQVAHRKLSELLGETARRAEKAEARLKAVIDECEFQMKNFPAVSNYGTVSLYAARISRIKAVAEGKPSYR